MESCDWKRRAAWLDAVANRMSAPNLSELLHHYSEEMLHKAEQIDGQDQRDPLRSVR